MGEIVSIGEKKEEIFWNELRRADFQEFKDCIVDLLIEQTNVMTNTFQIVKGDMDNAEHNFGAIGERMDGIALILLFNCIKTAHELGRPLSLENKKFLAKDLGLDWEHIQESLGGGGENL